MGEIAEMMLNGMLCESCGVAIGDEVGYPRCCPDCAQEDFEKPKQKPVQQKPKAKCPLCKRKVKRTGFLQHLNDAHGIDGVDVLIESLRNDT